MLAEDRKHIAFAHQDDLESGMWFSEEERRGFDLVSRAKRVSRMIGRIAVKKVAQMYLRDFERSEVDVRDLSVERATSGMPMLVVGTLLREDLSLSVSHTGPLAMAGMSARYGGNIGVDIEQIRSWEDKTLRDFLSPEELASYEIFSHSGEQDRFATLAWSLREAYLKARGVGLREHPRNLIVEALPYRRYLISHVDGKYPGAGEEHETSFVEGVSSVVAVSVRLSS